MRYLIIILSVLGLTACDEPTRLDSSVDKKVDVAPASPSASPNDAKVSWYAGSVDEAFAEAGQKDTPVFLYWGAVWCPPCQEIKHTVFKTQAFINLSELFIPVYLDGDTSAAQAWGETFGVKGYPTMIVFNPEGEEITRIPGGIDITRYNDVLALSLNRMRSTASLIQYALSEPDKLQSRDFEQLAYYSWGQDASAVPADIDQTKLFHTLAELAPDGELSSRFFMQYLVALSHAEEENEEEGNASSVTPLHMGDDQSALKLRELLLSEELVLACWDSIAYYAEEILQLPIFNDEQRQDLEQLWSERVFLLRTNQTLSKAEKMAGWLPRLYVETRGERDLAAVVQDKLMAEMAIIDAQTPDSYERQSVINQMSYVLQQAQMKNSARQLLINELDKSAAPYYFMSALGSFAEEEGDTDSAIAWRKQAYETAVGDATRFQWGASYVRALIRMKPEAADTIATLGNTLIVSFQQTSELFAGRNFRVLKNLDKEIRAWQKNNAVNSAPNSVTFSSKIESLCRIQEGGSVELKNCESLLVAEPQLIEPNAQQSEAS